MDTGIALYYRIANHLRNRIMSGIYKPGEKIPGENDLCQEFNISRVTIRQALKVLTDQKILKRKQGVGTIVNQDIMAKPINFNGYIEDIIFQLLPAKVIWYNKESTQPPKDIQKLLQLSENETVVTKLERVRAIGSQLNSYAINYLPMDIGNSISEEALNSHSLIELIDETTKISDATQQIKAISADKLIADRLKMKVGDPVLFSEYLMFSKDKRPINLAHVYYHADRYSYTVKMGRLTNPD